MTNTIPRPIQREDITLRGDRYFDVSVKFESVLLAVQWAKQEIYDSYHKIGRVEIWNASNDLVCDIVEERAIKIIEEAFKEIERK